MSSSCARIVSIVWTIFCAITLEAEEPCRIEVREAGSGWPVPLVILRTTSQSTFVTDNAGVAAFDLPEAMGRDTWLDISSPNYEMPADGFGYRGIRIKPEAGKTVRIEVHRILPARRLGRLTGSGLFGERARFGAPASELPELLVGQDSVQVAAHQGALYWFWGDTTLGKYPLGIFHTTGARTSMQPLNSFEPPLRLTYDYFRDGKGELRALAPMAGEGPTWLSAVASLPDHTGTPRLVATYVKIKPPLETYRLGLCVWDETDRVFQSHCVLWEKGKGVERPVSPDGHAALWTDHDGTKWVLFGNPLPTLRCPATFEAWQDPAQWEPVDSVRTLKAADTGAEVALHSGSIAWHPWRQRWVTVFMEKGGKPSAFGEVWYAEAPTPLGPWGRAVKVLSHENYTFYNPRLHTELTPTNSPILLFEGTYTRDFANRPVPTPRYEYNQILYRLDLNDPALAAAHVAETNSLPTAQPPGTRKTR